MTHNTSTAFMRHAVCAAFLLGQPLVQAQTISAKKPFAAAAVTQAKTSADTNTNAPTAETDPDPAEANLKLMADLLQLPKLLPLEEEGPALSLLDAAQMGLNNNPEAEAARWRVKSFEATSRAALGALLPRLELRFAAGKGRLSNSAASNALTRQDISAVLTQPVYDEAARQEWGRQKQLVGSAKAQLDGAESQAVLDTGMAWMSILQNRVSIELGQEYTALLNELERYISERVAGGGASPAERERVTARVANVRAGLIDNQAGLKAALRNFQRLTNITPSALNLDEVPTLELPDRVLTAQDMARTQNAEIRVSRAEREAAESERLVRRGAFLPRVAVELSHTRSLNSAGTEAKSTDTKGMMVMTMSLLNGGADMAQMMASEARRNELDSRTEVARRRVVQDLETAYTNLSASTQRLAAVREELVANRKVVEAFRAQLTSGNRQLLDVLDAYQRLHQSRLDLLQLVVNTTQIEWRVAHLTGRLQSLAVR